MNKKGIAIPYIIALILGIIVVGVIGYWFYITTTTGGASATLATCDSKKVQWCNDWAKTGYIPPITGPVILGSWDTFAPGCTNLGVLQPDVGTCRALGGTILQSGAVCTQNTECTSGVCGLTTECKAKAETYDADYNGQPKCASCREGTYDLAKNKCMVDTTEADPGIGDPIKRCT